MGIPRRSACTPPADADLAVSGELDVTTVDLFATTLDRTGVPDAPDELVVDATALTFTDHRNLLVLEQLAHRHDRSVRAADRASVAGAAGGGLWS